MLYFTETNYGPQEDQIYNAELKAKKLIDTVSQSVSTQLIREIQVRKLSRLIQLTIFLESTHKKLLKQKEFNEKLKEENKKLVEQLEKLNTD